MEISSLIFAVLSFILSVINFIELRASKLSTHKLEFINPTDNWEKEIDLLNVKEKENNNLDNIF